MTMTATGSDNPERPRPPANADDLLDQLIALRHQLATREITEDEYWRVRNELVSAYEATA